MNQQRTGNVSLGAVLALPVVILLSGVLALGNLAVAALTSAGPDSCGEVSCSGSGSFAAIFTGIAVFSFGSAVATAFTLRPARAAARFVLIAMALVVPVLADLVAFAAAPEWL
ncbi:hypothetical protein [Spirillospora sp. CA-128828]|uniref:hypothetical protein n=1 Tax=Spirillospora sp. CA-128828 TaxID=3240033 RepID=UPI003D94C37D